ncbi:RHS repeat-associated core domain-containing protein [Paenibacillus sp. 19GGS1-52]|uniref:RHS repeat-associated core domain-containing protein n=1 Tax=Paenibacillus sp. 19GGS1-52 TaxID=2758563 RepID=UPI001EFA6F1F|nr:RHS repeat-associated core domain-containing protein [Paenibacillus sp. 19GGS1-52]ULO09508.1 RHS repeat-associated core domain-containing protein [Paenibacillus sp. 19GGS1-52]
MTDETGTTQYQYNRDSTLRKVTYPDSKTVLYEYNESGTRKSMTDPFGAITLYLYDNDDRLTKVSLKESSTGAEATQAQYTYTGSVLDTITYGNGLITQYAYEDGFGRLTGMKHLKGSTILNQYSYTYDNNGNITERTSNCQTVTFGYDELDRIIASSEANEQYSYDVKGNRTVQLSTASSLHTDTMDYTYDQANPLKSVTRNGVVTAYKYDGDGLMREKNNGSTTRFYYDGENIIAEGSISGSTVSFKARYVRGYQLISMKNQWGTVGYYLENGHGDVVNLYKQDQTLLNTYDYDLWGNPKVTEEADQYSNPFRYAGEYWDTNTGLQNLRARWYDPSIGRFITEDTWEGRINHPDSQNPYVYVVNNPLRYVDPSGNYYWSVAGAIAGAIGNAGYQSIKAILAGDDILAAAAAGGLVEGAITGGFATSGVPILMAASGAVGSAVGNAVEQLVANDEPFSIRETLLEGFKGGGTNFGNPTNNAISYGIDAIEVVLERLSD